MLAGKYGNGATPEEAIRNYVPEISLRRIIIRAMYSDRQEINVPRLKSGIGWRRFGREELDAKYFLQK
jgi:hypothetical protein